MAMKPKAGFAAKAKSQNYSTKWLRNALKSVGISTQEAIKEISPNLYEITNTGVTTSRNLINSMRRNANNTNRVGETLSSNKYVQYAQKAYRNAMSDIKSGNFNNQDRMSDAMQSSFGGADDLKDGFSFGDDGADSAGNVNVNYINNGADNGAMLHLSTQIQNQTNAQLKTQKASMDAYIAVNAASMQQVGQIGAEIVGQLTNMNNNLSAIVQYQNDNMTRFIEASIAYYERTGAAITQGKDGQSSNEKLSAKDVFNSRAGGINMGRYKTYVKQQAKDLFDHSNIGLLKSLADDPMMMDMIVSNPIGFLSQGLIGHMIPTVLKTSMETMDKTLANFMPTMLSKIGDLADTQGNDFVSQFKRVLGKTFGLRNERTTKIGNIQINREAIPFDGETKHAITEIITKELRDQSGYLEIIANHFSKGNAKEQVRANGEYWSYGKNGYIKREEIDIEIADKIVGSIRDAFNSTGFGKTLKAGLVDTRKGDKAKKEMENTIDELFVEIEKQKGHVTLEDLLTLIEHGGASNTTKNIIKDFVKNMAHKNRSAFDSLNTGRLNSQGAAEEMKKSIMSDYIGNNLLNSSFNGDSDVDEILEKVKKYGKSSDKKQRNVKGMKKYTHKYDNSDGYSAGVISGDTVDAHGKKLKSMLEGATSGSISILQSIMSGDTQGVINKGADFITKGLMSIGNKLQEMSKKEGGIVWQIKENFVSMGTSIKDGLMSKFFGKKKDKDGNYVPDEKEKGGIFGSIKGIFTDGLNGWVDAFFGKDEKDPEKAREQHKKSIIDAVKGALPNGITGGLVGAGVGMMSGGVLSMLIGGPIGGAVLGAATGFLSKNEKFQQWLFGKDNEDGSHTEGLISKKVQDYFKENKNKLIGGGAVGAVTGAITGGGLLGTLVGGPIAGSLLGMAGSVIVNSDMFKKFLYGDQEKGQKGLFKAISDAFNKGAKKTGGENSADGKKTLGMGIFGAGAGTLTAALLGKMGVLGASLTPLGPVGGALAGLALSIKAQSGTFKQWLFGEKDGLKLGDGRKIKKQGVLGQLGNTITASVINPMKHEIEYIAKDFMSTVKHKVLAPFAFTAEVLSGKFGELFGKLSDQINGAVGGLVSFAKDTVKSLFGPVTEAVGGIMKSATDFTWKAMKKVMTTPGNIAVAAIKALGLKEKFNELKPVKFFKGLAADIRNLVFTGIKSTFKLIGKVAAAPFKLLGWGIGKLWKGTKFLAGKATEGIRNKVKGSKFGQRFSEAYHNLSRGNGDENDSIWQRMRRSNDEYKKDQAEIKAMREKNKIHDDNAKLIAKISKGQFSQDTEEARTWLKYHDPKSYKKLVGESITTETEIEKHGKGTKGMNLERANINELSEEGKQTKLLFDIRKIIDNIVHKMQGDDETYENDEERDQREAKEAEEQAKAKSKQSKLANHVARRKKWVEYEGFMVNTETGEVRNGNFTEITDPSIIPDKVLEYVKGIQEEGIPEAPTTFTQKIDKIKQGFTNVKNYFKNDFFSNTRGNYDKYIRNGAKTWSEEFLTKHTNGQFGSDSHEARAWLQQNNPEAYAKFLSKVTGQKVDGYSIGGVLKQGLSIVGEKGAELLFKDKNGKTSVLDAESTEEAIDDATRKKKKGKLSQWINKVSSDNDSSLENHSDEARLESKFSASFRARQHDGKMSAADEASMMKVMEIMDARRDSASNALGKAKNAEQVKKEKEEEKARKEQKQYQDAMLATTKENTESSKGYHKTWDSLWNPKKGLFLVAGLAIFSMIKKHFPGLISTIGKIASGIIDFLGGVIGETAKDLSWTSQHAGRTDGNTAGEQANMIIDNFKNGDIITDPNGNATAWTDGMLSVMGRTALNFKNSKFHMPFESKATKMQKKVFNGVKWVGEKTGKAGKWIGTKAGNYMKNTGDLAKWALQEGDEVLEAGTKMERLGAKAINSKAGQKIGGIVNKGKGMADNLVGAVKNSKVVTKGKALIDDVGKGAVKAKDTVVKNAKNSLSAVGDIVTKKAGKNDGMLSKICGYIDEFFTFIKKQFKKKAGKEAGDSIFGKVSKKGLQEVLEKNWDNIGGKLVAKITGKTTAGAAAAAVSAGLTEVAFAAIGAINGASGAAKLFHVSSKAVDGTMTLISSIFGGLAGTTIGGIIDIILSVLGSIMGCDILHSIAVALYNVIVGKDSKKAEKLANAQADFKDAYLEDRNKELEKQYNTQLKAGIIGPEVTYDMFVAGVEDGTYEASYTSFEDWNTNKNKSIGDHIGSAFGKAWKGIKKGGKAVGKFLFGGKETQYKDKNGNTYTENSDGTWQVKDADGKDLGSISKDAIPKDAEKTTLKTDNILVRGAKAVGNLGKKAGKAIASGAKKAGKAIAKGAKKAGKAVGGFLKGIGNAITGKNKKKKDKKKDDDDDKSSAKLKPASSSFMKKVKDLSKTLHEKGASVLEKAKATIANATDKAANVYKEIKEKGVSGFIGGLFKKEKSLAWYDAQGNYYKLEKGDTYSYYNVNGDVLEENIPATKVEEMAKTGLLTKGEVTGKSKAQEMLSGIKNAASEGWNKAKDSVKDGWKKAKDSVKKGWSAVKSWFKGGKGIGGGYGADTVNGQPYYAQNDSRWGSKPYTSGMDKATMANTGCGPTAMAMVASGMGKSVNPMDMANLAKATGNRDASGTNWNFVNQVSPMVGLSSHQRLNPSAKDIDAQLSMGNPVLLSGVGSGNGSDPYTKAGHYVVAVGKDANNNVLINDPRGKQYSKAYNLNNVAGKTGSSWTFGGRGPQVQVSTYESTGGTGVGVVERWVAIVQSVKQAIAAQMPGYSQSRWIKITVGGRTLSVRTDCTGFIAAAAKLFGAIDENVNIYTGNMLDNNCPLASKGCFKLSPFPGWDKLQVGDIVVKRGHAEIYAGSSGGKYYVYNCGSDKSVNNPSMTGRSYAAYTHIWRPVQPGTESVTNVSVSDTATTTSTTDTSATVNTSAATSTTSSGDKLGDLTSFLGGFFSEFGSRVVGGNFTNTDYSSIKPGSTTTETTTTGGSGSGAALRRKSGNIFKKSGRKADRISSVDYASRHGIQSKRSQDQYNLAGNAQKYITVSKDSSMQALMMNAIEILAAIAGNTSDASTKLNALGQLQNLSVNGGNSTNVIVGADGQTKATTVPKENSTEVRNTYVAKQIARGGY